MKNTPERSSKNAPGESLGAVLLDPQLLAALRLLLQAAEYAGSAARSQWEFAVEIDVLHQAGYYQYLAQSG